MAVRFYRKSALRIRWSNGGTKRSARPSFDPILLPTSPTAFEIRPPNSMNRTNPIIRACQMLRPNILDSSCNHLTKYQWSATPSKTSIRTARHIGPSERRKTILAFISSASHPAFGRSKVAAMPRENTIPATNKGSVIAAIGFPVLNQLHNITNIPKALFEATSLGGRHGDRCC